MKRSRFLALAALSLPAALFAISAAAQQGSAPPVKAASPGPLKTEKDRLSYSIGLDIGKNFKGQGIQVDAQLLARGLRDALTGAKPLLTEEQAHETLAAFQMGMRAQQAKKMQAQGEANLKEGEAFLAKNKSQTGVMTTASGLQYKVLTEGNGKSPGKEDTVTAHYRGTLINGTEFDSSHKRGQPANFPVSGVIPGWTEALQMMKTGAKWMVWIPSSLAYGERGAGPVIGPNATLIFEIELLDVKKP
jgi:FKBP-type peptidyl-prolyl cis-trans isomerase FklB